MLSVTVSPKFQVVIPREVRDKLALKPGQKLLMYVRDGAIHMEPPRSIRELFGIAPGIRWQEGDRDRNDRY
jgi:AbrB family looped-hinge helix DNA binding protein